MGEITTGIYSFLSNPLIYDSFQFLMGTSKKRKDFVDEFVRPNSNIRVLDMGCGTADILHYLPGSVEYWGYDISKRYIDAASQRFGDRGHFFCAYLGHCELGKMPKFDIILAIGLLHHLDDLAVQELLSIARTGLNPKGRVITLDGCYAPEQNPVARLLISMDRGQNVRSPEAYKALASSVFPKVTGHLRHRRWIPYTHWIMECSY